MSHEKFKRTVIVLGPLGHGKTTFTSAISKVQSENGSAEFISYDSLDKWPKEDINGVQVTAASIKFKIELYAYTYIDFPSHADAVKYLNVKKEIPYGAIVVVSMDDFLMSQTKEYIMQVRNKGISNILVIVNKIDLLISEEEEYGSLSDTINQDICILLREQGYYIDHGPIFFESAQKVLEGDEDYAYNLKEVINFIDNNFFHPDE